jgi:hypothetical protein
MTSTERSRHFPKITLVIVITIALCFVLVFLYARLGGKWASSLVIPIPPSSDLVAESLFVSGLYNNSLRLYEVNQSLDQTRNWFTSNGIPMSPVDGKLNTDDQLYFSLPISGTGRPEYRLLFTAAMLSANPKAGSYEHEPDCFGVHIYKSLDVVDYPDFSTLFPDQVRKTSGNNTLLLVRSCWPDW